MDCDENKVIKYMDCMDEDVYRNIRQFNNWMI